MLYGFWFYAFTLHVILMGTMDWQTFVAKITALKCGDEVEICGVRREILALAHYRTDNLGDSDYLKASFSDGSFLLVLLADEVLMFTDEIVHHITEITDEEIGAAEVLNYQGQEFKLVNKDDYQFVLRWYFGKVEDLEGEVKFSDYEPTDGSVGLLSLGWLAKNGERADICVNEIALDKISF